MQLKAKTFLNDIHFLTNGEFYYIPTFLPDFIKIYNVIGDVTEPMNNLINLIENPIDNFIEQFTEVISDLFSKVMTIANRRIDFIGTCFGENVARNSMNEIGNEYFNINFKLNTANNNFEKDLVVSVTYNFEKKMPTVVGLTNEIYNNMNFISSVEYDNNYNDPRLTMLNPAQDNGPLKLDLLNPDTIVYSESCNNSFKDYAAKHKLFFSNNALNIIDFSSIAMKTLNYSAIDVSAQLPEEEPTNSLKDYRMEGMDEFLEKTPQCFMHRTHNSIN